MIYGLMYSVPLIIEDYCQFFIKVEKDHIIKFCQMKNESTTSIEEK